MTALDLAPPNTGQAARLRGVLQSEWTKIRSVRSTYWSILGAVFALVGLGALFCGLYVARHGPGFAEFDAWRRSIRGVFLAQIAIGVIGILTITGEFGTGMIRSTFAAVPARNLVLAAKGLVFGAVVLVVGMVSAFAAFGIGQAILSDVNAGVSLSDPGITRAVIGVGLYLTVIGLFALGIGTLIRHTAGAIATLFGILLVAPLLAAALPSPWDNDVSKFLPGNAGLALIGAGITPGRPLSPWTGFGVLCAWTAAVLALAAWSLRTRDV